MKLTQTLHSVAASVFTSVAPIIPRPSVPSQMIVPPITVPGWPSRASACHTGTGKLARTAPDATGAGTQTSSWRKTKERQNVPPYHRRERPELPSPSDDHQY